MLACHSWPVAERDHYHARVSIDISRATAMAGRGVLSEENNTRAGVYGGVPRGTASIVSVTRIERCHRAASFLAMAISSQQSERTHAASA